MENTLFAPPPYPPSPYNRPTSISGYAANRKYGYCMKTQRVLHGEHAKKKSRALEYKFQITLNDSAYFWICNVPTPDAYPKDSISKAGALPRFKERIEHAGSKKCSPRRTLFKNRSHSIEALFDDCFALSTERGPASELAGLSSIDVFGVVFSMENTNRREE